MTRNELARQIYDISHLTGVFKLRSGIESNEYFDKYQFESKPELLNEIAKQIVNKINFSEYDYLAALEMGGIPIAVAISVIIGKPMVFVRKKAKEYGTAKLAEGPDTNGKKLIIIEDVVTSGGQIILSTKDLRNFGAIIDTAVCVIDRQSGGTQKLREHNIELVSLFTMEDLKF